MAKYKFEWLNNSAEITDPEVVINPIVREVNPVAMTITVDLTLVTESARFSVTLENVQVVNLNYDADSLTQRVLTRLEDFIVE